MKNEKLITMHKRKLRLLVIKERIKKVRSLEHELRAIYHQQRGLGYIELKKPIRDGWYRTLALREDIAKHKKAYVYQEIIDKVEVRFWGREKKYADKAWKKYYHEQRHLYLRNNIRYLRKKAYLSLSTAAKRYFTRVRIKVNYKYRKVYICMLPK